MSGLLRRVRTPRVLPDADRVGAAEDWMPFPAPKSPEVGPEPLPHVVAWNLTRRCNLACAHCYISAGAWQTAEAELSADECRRIMDEIFSLNSAPMFVLSGGEPLVRTDLELIARHASASGATVVVGTNGIGLTAERIASLQEAGVKGVALSVDSLDPRYHDRFRHGDGALLDTLAAVERLRDAKLDFVIQTTLSGGNRRELGDLVAWAAGVGAVSFNLYFLVATGRGVRMEGLGPGDNEEVLSELVRYQRAYRGRMLIRSKCQPQIMRHVAERDPDSPLLNYATRCPCGVQYCRITPEGKLTPCPYLPAVAGDLRREPFADVWRSSPLLESLRAGKLGGKCGRCEYRLICGGCRARAYATSGDPLGEDTSCAHEPTGDLEPIQPRKISYGVKAERSLEWSAAAEERLAVVPSFVRGVVSARVEEYAKRAGETLVTPELMERVRSELPVDFSRRRPNFLKQRK